MKMSYRVLNSCLFNKSFCSSSNILLRCISTQSKTIGFIGLGNMGTHMASNLIKNGHSLCVYDISKSACDILKSKGANICQSSQEVANQSGFVITMLPNNEIVSQTYQNMVTDATKKETYFIDSSTIDPNVAKSIEKYVKSKGSNFVDAPVSGGVVGAEDGTLSFMVGGQGEHFNKIKNILECMGKKITHCGGIGMGQAAKLCNNMMLAISMIGISETMNLAIRLGLDPKLFMDIINASTGRCWSSEIYNPVPGLITTVPASKNYEGGFSTDLMSKDLGLVSGVAMTSNTPIPLGAMANQIYTTLRTKGFGNKDFSIIYQFLKE